MTGIVCSTTILCSSGMVDCKASQMEHAGLGASSGQTAWTREHVFSRPQRTTFPDRHTSIDEPSTVSSRACHFFRLPVELRLAIYELALGRPSIHVWTRNNITPSSKTWPHQVRTWNTRHLPASQLRTMHLRTGHAVCSKPHLFHEQYERSLRRPPSSAAAAEEEEEEGEDHDLPPPNFCVQACSSTKLPDLTGIILTCRKAYAEAQYLPYELFTFVFVTGFHAEHFLRRALTPQQASRVRHLHFERWHAQPDVSALNQWADLALYRQVSMATVGRLRGLRRVTYRDLEFCGRADGIMRHGIMAFRDRGKLDVRALFECDGEADREAARQFEELLMSEDEGDPVSGQELAYPGGEPLWCCPARCRNVWEPYDWKERDVMADVGRTFKALSYV